MQWDPPSERLQGQVASDELSEGCRRGFFRRAPETVLGIHADVARVTWSAVTPRGLEPVCSLSGPESWLLGLLGLEQELGTWTGDDTRDGSRPSSVPSWPSGPLGRGSHLCSR